ncbi:MAG: myeloperoxidase thyroid peroxidase cyclooxygenase catalytic subunit [Conexibacter sp.]|nr:myeloperoxidase thyroid peroxidase cyclooxygenase catalytic subunit [Conexibacter sp.]
MPGRSLPASGPPSTTPTAPSPHGSPPRGLVRAPQSSLAQGRFGRMFRNLPVYAHQPETLATLGGLMIQPIEDPFDKDLDEKDEDENTSTLPGGELRLPAGYTYFGQFVDHDITFDPVSSLTRQNDPDGLTDFRTPRYDLDSVYGRGPSDQPYLYESDGLRLRLGDPVSDDPNFAGPDLLRAPNPVDAERRALIGDPRNDENLIVSQLQVTMIKFHNKVVAHLEDTPGIGKDDLFKLAQKTVRWHYQWVVVHDFLPRLVGEETIADVLDDTGRAVFPGGGPGDLGPIRPKLRFYAWHERPYMPVEFSVAAYRYGHSMIRPSYFINDIAHTVPAIAGTTRIRLFLQGASEHQALNGFGPLASQWGVQWKYFLPGIHDAANPQRDGFLPQPSYKIDAELANPLSTLTDVTAGPEVLFAGADATLAQDLAIRNLLRGLQLGLPSGQAVAGAMGVEPLGEDDLLADLVGGPLPAGAKEDLRGNAPLWYYILKEAEVRAGSAHLGPVGGRIVAEVLLGLLVGDPLSYLEVQPRWTPELPGAVAGRFTLSDLVNFALGA